MGYIPKGDVMSNVKETNVVEKLGKLQQDSVVAGLNKLASNKVPQVEAKPEVKYEFSTGCGGEPWRREIKGNGRFGEWERVKK